MVGSLSGLTEGHFPVYAHARYADDMSVAKAAKKVGVNHNAAQLIESSATRKGINIFAKAGSPVIAVNDGVIKKMGTSTKLGKYIVLQDVYGNQYTYSGLGDLSRVYPVPKTSIASGKTIAKALSAHVGKPDAKLPKPTAPASAGLQKPGSSASARSSAKKSVAPKVLKVKKLKLSAQSNAGAAPAATKERLFAAPEPPGLEVRRRRSSRSSTARPRPPASPPSRTTSRRRSA